MFANVPFEVMFAVPAATGVPLAESMIAHAGAVPENVYVPVPPVPDAIGTTPGVRLPARPVNAHVPSCAAWALAPPKATAARAVRDSMRNSLLVRRRIDDPPIGVLVLAPGPLLPLRPRRGLDLHAQQRARGSPHNG